MEERCRLGLCFNCNKKFGRRHNRVCQRICLLDLAPDDDNGASKLDDAAIDNTQISLHAITGVRTSEMMQIHLTLGSISLHTLIDSGFMHNFIVEEAAAHTTLTLPLLG